MTRFATPPPGELPTTRQLNRATLLAAAAAAVILVTTVLPAEYGIDPTGVGGVLGLTPMGQMKQGAAAPVAVKADGPGDVQLTLRGYGAKEVKATMKAGEQISYRWSTDGEAVEFDLHGDPKDASLGEASYEKGTSAGASGTVRAAFDGLHGWYWHNLGPKPVTITVSITGQYEKFAPID